MLRHRPALRVIILLVTGILLADIFPLSWRFLWILLALAFALTCILAAVAPRSVWTLGGFHFAVIILAATWAEFRTEEVRRRRFEPSPAAATIGFKAFLEEQPLKQGATCKLVVQCDSVRIGGNLRPGGRFLCFLPWKKAEHLHSLKVGSELAVWGSVQDFPRPRNPGEFDYGRFLGLNDIQGIVRVESTFVSADSRGWSVRSWFAGLRADFGQILAKHHAPEQAGFLQGVLFGDRKDIPAELKESFMNTGTIHILAVSGSNVATIALMLYLVLGLLRFPKRLVVIITVGGLLFYMLLTGAASSIVRATIMGCVIVIGTAMERRTDIYNSICVAAVMVLLIDPLQLFDVGFQLSFVAVLSIVMLYPILDSAIRRIPESWEEFKILEPVWKVFAVSLAAQLGTLPFTAFYFERFSIVSLLANVAVVPLVGLNLILGCVTIGAEFLGSWVAECYAALNELLVALLLGFVRRAAEVPFAAVETYGFGVLSGIFYYAVLLGTMNIRNRRLVKIAVFSMLLIAASGVIRNILREERSMQLLMFDVGQGDALLLRFPNGANVLVDAGPRTFSYDAGKRVLIPFLARQGVTRLDAVVLSHPHSDHIGGLEAVLNKVQVAVIYEADTVTASRMHGEMRRVASERGVRLMTAGTGDEISPDPNVRLYVIHPTPGHDRFGNLNNNSLVLKLTYGASEALLCGDAELEAEKLMSERYRSFLEADILKAGHHGSSTSSSDDFLHGITPKFAIISVGTANKFKHPSPRVVERLISGGTRVLRTDLEGALLFTSDGTAWKHIDWR